jgi:hypothetical protein
MKLCQNCVMPVKEKETLCKECKTFKKVCIDWDKREKELKELFGKFGKIGPKYDCSVLIHTDNADLEEESLYTLYYLTRVLGLRVLAIVRVSDVDNEENQKNMMNAVNMSGVDYEIVNFDDNVSKLRYAMFKTMRMTCFCQSIMALRSLKITIENKIPILIVPYRNYMFNKELIFTVHNQKYQKRMLKKFYRGVNNLFYSGLRRCFDKEVANQITKNIIGSLNEYIGEKETFYPIVTSTDYYFKKLPQEQQLEILKTYYNFEPTENDPCRIKPVAGYIADKLGSKLFLKVYSTIVRKGAKSREECLRKIVRFKNPNEYIIQDYLKTVGITEKEFHNLLEQNNFFVKAKLLWTMIKLYKSLSWALGFEIKFLKKNN